MLPGTHGWLQLVHHQLPKLWPLPFPHNHGRFPLEASRQPRRPFLLPETLGRVTQTGMWATSCFLPPVSHYPGGGSLCSGLGRAHVWNS